MNPNIKKNRDATEAVFRGKFKDLSIYIRKEEITDLNFNLKKSEKEKQTKSKGNRSNDKY